MVSHSSYSKLNPLSDSQIEARIADLLAQRNVPALRRLSVEARDGVVTLRGRVNTFYEKQLSHHVVRQLPEVSKLVDEIDVRSHDRPAPLRRSRGFTVSFGRLPSRFV